MICVEEIQNRAEKKPLVSYQSQALHWCVLCMVVRTNGDSWTCVSVGGFLLPRMYVEHFPQYFYRQHIVLIAWHTQIHLIHPRSLGMYVISLLFPSSLNYTSKIIFAATVG